MSLVVGELDADDVRDLDRTLAGLRRALAVFLAVAIVGALALMLVFHRLGEVEAMQRDGRSRGLKNRVVPCVALMSRAEVGSLPRYCTDADALPYLCVAAGDVDPAWVTRVEHDAGQVCVPPAGG